MNIAEAYIQTAIVDTHDLNEAARRKLQAERAEADKPENAYRMTEVTLNRWRNPRKAVLVTCTKDPHGYKTRAMRLCEGLKGKWTHRSGGYTLSCRAARRFETMYALGYDASVITGEIWPPGGG